jgi:hypothetical protein
MKQRNVILHGGVGNQLFQWAFAHYIRLTRSQIHFCFFERDYTVKHAQISIAKILKNCSHGKFEIRNLPKNPVLHRLLDPVSQYNPLKLSKKFLDNSIQTPFSKRDTPIDSKYYYGYFQNWQYVSANHKVLYDELCDSLYTNNLNALEKRLLGSEIVHIRQGDTKNQKNFQRVGVLNKDYYKSLPRKGTRERFIITDDIDGAISLVEDLQFDGIFGPDEINEISALRIMGNASTLYTANSTFSWWGGFLAVHRNSEVIIPDPFFLDVQPPPRSAFSYPGFTQKKSTFMSSIQD